MPLARGLPRRRGLALQHPDRPALLVTSAGLAPVARSAEWIVLCTGYASCRAAGYSDSGYEAVSSTSYWRQSTGHNCTNYVAYRLVRNGMPNERPASLTGNAYNWGPAFADLTDDKPVVGSVAWWDTSFSSTGHVAYVEKVVSPTRSSSRRTTGAATSDGAG